MQQKKITTYHKDRVLDVTEVN